MNSGTLYLVATPIGNLNDLSPRAQQVLHSVGLILAEDTRKFAIIARRFEVSTRVKSFYEQNERAKTNQIIEQLTQGVDIALVSDAGTPTISDPGYLLVNAAWEANIPVVSIPGPCALIAALVTSGFESHRFCFEGFLSHKPGKKQKALERALESQMTTIFYESPHRIIKTLKLLEELNPRVEVYIGRELTKVYEESLRGPVCDVVQELAGRNQQKGEFVLILRGIP